MRIYYYRAFPSQPIRMHERTCNTSHAPVSNHLSVILIGRVRLFRQNSVLSVTCRFVSHTALTDSTIFRFFFIYFSVKLTMFLSKYLTAKKLLFVSRLILFFVFILSEIEHRVFIPRIINKQVIKLNAVNLSSTSPHLTHSVSSLVPRQNVSASQNTVPHREGDNWLWAVNLLLIDKKPTRISTE